MDISLQPFRSENLNRREPDANQVSAIRKAQIGSNSYVPHLGLKEVLTLARLAWPG
jgi:hypothetical protein